MLINHQAWSEAKSGTGSHPGSRSRFAHAGYDARRYGPIRHGQSQDGLSAAKPIIRQRGLVAA
jgi:hypothetical protein